MAGKCLQSYRRECYDWAISLNQIQRRWVFHVYEDLRGMAELAGREVPTNINEPQWAIVRAAANTHSWVQLVPTPLRNGHL